MGNRHSTINDGPGQLLAVIARVLIRTYQCLISKRLGRTCLFEPSCSHRALAFFRDHNFNTALRRVRQQLQNCRGDYSLRLDEHGRVELITESGMVVSEPEVNPQVVERIRFMQNFGVSRHDRAPVPDKDLWIQP
jgi:putative component of membrane protein insertase Oxa1/YidC/SpoIIIJ protein YidD